MNRSIFVYGPQGCGKTTNAVQLAKHFGLNRIADEADLRAVPTHRDWKFDTLYLTQERPLWASPDDRRVLDFYDAMALMKADAR